MITFNSVAYSSFSEIHSIMRISRPLAPDMVARVAEIAGRDGVYFFSKNRQPLVLSFRIATLSASASARRTLARQLSAWLDTDQPAALVVSDETDKRYQAILLDSVPFEEVARVGFADVSFFVPSGYAEAVSLKTASPNAGTMPAPVTITATLGGSASALQITLGSEYLRLETTLVSTDVVIFNTETGLVTLNGADARRYVTYASTFFKLPVGAFSLTVDPVGTPLVLSFRERWK